MEATCASDAPSKIDLSTVFSDIVRLETDLWNLIDRRLRRDHDLPLSWFEPMHVMDRVPDCRVGDIAQTLSITVGGTSKLVDRIEQAGWCERRPNPDDARSSLVYLTKTGRHLLIDAQKSLTEELEASLGSALPRRRLASLASTVRDVRRHLAHTKGPTR